MAPDTIIIFRTLFDEKHKFTVKTHVAEWSNQRDWVTSSTTKLKSMSLELQTVAHLVSEAAQRRLELADTNKYIVKLGRKLP